MRARRRRVQESDNNDRWLVSYADFITLLFAFFVVMYAISSVNEKKYDAVTNSLGVAFGANVIKIPEAVIIEKKSPVIADPIKPIAISLRQSLNQLVENGTIKITEDKRGIRIDIYDSLLFSSGSAALESMSAIKILDIISPILTTTDLPVEIEGHTDNQPIQNNQFPSNWELSAIRATSVLQVLNKSGISDDRLSATGYGSSRPIVVSLSLDGEPINRRVSIIVLREKR